MEGSPSCGQGERELTRLFRFVCFFVFGMCNARCTWELDCASIVFGVGQRWLIAVRHGWCTGQRLSAGFVDEIGVLRVLDFDFGIAEREGSIDR